MIVLALRAEKGPCGEANVLWPMPSTCRDVLLFIYALTSQVDFP